LELGFGTWDLGFWFDRTPSKRPAHWMKGVRFVECGAITP
jgi:hypothetical protein